MLETILWALGGLVVVVALCAWLLFRYFRSQSTFLAAIDARCDTAFADIDVHLKHRHDLIPRLVEVLKSQTSYEKEMVMGVAEARVEAMRALSPDIKLEAEKKLSAQVINLLNTAERDPDLRSLPDYRKLREEIVACDNRITAARRFYNLAIEEYNVTLAAWPTSSIASKRRMSKRMPFDLGLDRIMMEESRSLGL